MIKNLNCALVLIWLLTLFISPNISESLDANRVGLITKARSHLSNWQPKEALKLIDQLGKLGKEDPYYFFFKAKINFFLGNYQEADKFIREFTDKEKGWETLDEVVRIKNLIQKTLTTTKDFKSITRGHFEIRFQEGKERVLIDDAFAALENSYQKIGEALGHFPQETILVEIYPSAESFTEASGIPKKAVETSGTCALCSYNKILITSPRATLRGYRWLDTLCHEYVHFVVYKIAGPKTPLWMQEGLAKYLETLWRSPSGRGLNPGEENILARRFKADTLITFEQMTPSFAFLKTSQDVRLAFAQVMTIIQYLDKTYTTQSLRKALKSLANGNSIQKTVQDVYQTDLNGILEKWKKYLKEKGLKVWPDLHYEEIIFKDPDKETQEIEEEEEQLKHIVSKPVRKFVKLGDMLKSRSRPKAAVMEYQKAKAVSKVLSPVLENKLAMAYYLSQDTQTARKILIETERIFPNYVTSYTNLGLIYSKEGKWQLGVKQLEEAKDINPFNPWVYNELVKLYTKLNQSEKANIAQEKLKLFQKVKW